MISHFSNIIELGRERERELDVWSFLGWMFLLGFPEYRSQVG
jgi:hypothetical protein